MIKLNKIYYFKFGGAAVFYPQKLLYCNNSLKKDIIYHDVANYSASIENKNNKMINWLKKYHRDILKYKIETTYRYYGGFSRH